MFEQEFLFLYIFLSSIFTFFYFRNKDADFENREKFLFILGAILFGVGCFTAYVAQGYSELIKILLLEESHLSGKFIIASYIVFFLAIFLYLDKKKKESFKRQKRNKHE